MEWQPQHKVGDRLLTHLYESPDSSQGRAVPAASVIRETEAKLEKIKIKNFFLCFARWKPMLG